MLAGPLPVQSAEAKGRRNLAAPEEQLNAVLNDASRERRVEATERSRIVYVVIRHCEVRLIEQVEELHAYLQSQMLSERSVLEDGHVRAYEARPCERVSRQTAEAYLRARSVDDTLRPRTCARRVSESGHVHKAPGRHVSERVAGL